MVYLKENYKKILPYAGIFFVLFMGSGLVKIPIGSIWFYVIKFGIIAAVLGIGVSAWWKAKKNNEPPIDYLKLALFVPFTNDTNVYYGFIFLTIILFNKKLLLPWNSPLKPIYLLFIWGFISYVVNQFIEINPLSFPLFIYTFFLPLTLFSLFYTSMTKKNLFSIVDYYLLIVGLMMLIIIAQTIFLWDLHPDLRDGGTNHAHTAAVYMSIGILLICYKYAVTNTSSIKEFMLIPIAFVLMFFMDVKYILFFLVIALLPFLILLMKENKIVRLSLIIGIPSIILFWIFILDARIYHSVLALDDQNYKVVDLLKNYPNSEKGRLLTNYNNLVIHYPLNAIIGTGPGTFLSRASYYNSDEYINRWRTNYKGSFYSIKDFLNGNNNQMMAWVRLKYGEGKEYFEGLAYKTTFYDWRSSFINLVYEFGIIGILLIVYFLFLPSGFSYLSREYFVLTPIALFCFLMLFLDLWYEYPRYRIIQDAILGSVFVRFSKTGLQNNNED